MTHDKIEEQVRDALQTMRPGMADGWQGRAEAAMHAAYWTSAASRWAWAPRLAGVAVVLLALGVLPVSVRDRQGLVHLQAAPRGVAAREGSQPSPGEGPAAQVLLSYRHEAIRFVQSRAPHDPELLMGAGLLADDKRAGLRLLKAAAEESDSPTAWAAYVDRLILLGPTYRRPGNLEPDQQGLPDQEARVAQMNARDGIRDHLTATEAAPILEALRRWEQAEPDNAYPPALEMKYRYGLHQDEVALARWKAAAARPMGSSHTQDITRAVARLLACMGAGRIELYYNAWGAIRPRGFLQLQECGHLAQYEAARAVRQGRAQQAVQWWKASADLGHHLQDSRDDDLDFMIGYGLERIGVSPSWARDRGDGHYYYGPQHARFVRVLGEATDAELRDRFLRAEQRLRWLTEAQHRELHSPLRNLEILLSTSQVLTWLVVALSVVLLFVVAGGRARREKPQQLAAMCRALLVAVTVLPAFAGGALVWVLMTAWGGREVAEAVLFGGQALTFVLALVLPLIGAGRPRGAAWRGRVRQTLPAVVVLCATLALGLFLTGRYVEQRDLQRLVAYGDTGLSALAQRTDPAWTNPQIPTGLWRAQYPGPAGGH